MTRNYTEELLETQEYELTKEQLEELMSDIKIEDKKNILPCEKVVFRHWVRVLNALGQINRILIHINEYRDH